MATKRCGWLNEDPLYIHYHDTEWGVPLRDDQKIFEFFCLESAQAGLSWFTILKKRENYREAFEGFDCEKVARFSRKKIESLMKNAGIVRNRAKIEAAVNNAHAFIAVQDEFGSFSDYAWRLMDGRPLQNTFNSLREIPAKTDLSDLWTKDLKRRGFKFLGSTVVYAHMQASGMVNDHMVDCFRHGPVSKLA